MKSLVVAAAISGLFVLTGVAGWLQHNAFQSNSPWNHKAIANVHEASLTVGIMLADERHAYETGLNELAAQHKRLDNYTIYEVTKLGDSFLQQRHAGMSSIEINEKSDLESAINLINAKHRIVENYRIDRNRLTVTMNEDAVTDVERRVAKDVLRRVWAVSYDQHHHRHGPPPVFTSVK
jgi:hypothetical protein